MKSLAIFNSILIFYNGAKNGENKITLLQLKHKMIAFKLFLKLELNILKI